MSPGLWFRFSWQVYKLTEHCRNYRCFSDGWKGSMFYFTSKWPTELILPGKSHIDKKFNLREKTSCFKFSSLPKAGYLRTSVPALSFPKLKHWLTCRGWGWGHSWSSVEAEETFPGWDFWFLFSWQTGIIGNSFALQVCIKMHEACKAGAGRRKMCAICGNCGLLWLLNWHIYMLHCS